MYFADVKTLEDLKKEYHKLVFQYHPDRGGDEEIMKQINNEYDSLFNKLKNTHRNNKGEVFTSKEENIETPEEFKNIVETLMRMKDIKIEIIGCFVWVTGETKQYRQALKEMRFQWHSKKQAWYLKPITYRCRKKNYSFDEIRDMFGTYGQMDSDGLEQLDA